MKAILSVIKNPTSPLYKVSLIGKEDDPEYFNVDFSLSGNDLGNILYAIAQGVDKMLKAQEKAKKFEEKTGFTEIKQFKKQEL